mgnify:CR=1 FL=1
MLWTLFLLLKAKKGGKVLDSIFLYVEKNGEITITGLKEGVSDTSIVIPETIDGMPVIEIGPKAFQSTSITDIKIGANIRKIGDEAFYSCEKLSSVTWNQKCDVIPSDCFAECSNLTQFDFSNIKRIGAHAFENSGLTSVRLSKETAVDQSGFACCNDLEKIEWLSARNIKGDIFKECKNIKEIYISDKVKNIEASAFASSPNAEITFI